MAQITTSATIVKHMKIISRYVESYVKVRNLYCLKLLAQILIFVFISVYHANHSILPICDDIFAG